MSFDLFRSLKSSAEFLQRIEHHLPCFNVANFNLDAFLRACVGDISHLTEDEYKKNKAKSLIAEKENPSITVKLFRFFWNKNKIEQIKKRVKFL
jgi:hypothetical protein